MALDGLLDATPILMLIALGVALRLSGLINQAGGLVLTRLAYHVTIPAAIFVSIARSDFEPRLLLLPALGFVVPILLAGVMYWTTPHLRTQPLQRGPLLVGMVVLGVFAFPFMELFFGPSGLARIALYDVGNAFYAGLLATYFARAFGRRASRLGRLAWLKGLASPILFAAVAGAACSILQVQIKGPLASFLDRLAAANTPLAMIAVGIFLRPRRAYGRLVAQFILIRMALGGLVGWMLGRALGADPLTLIAATVGSSLPAGTTVLVFSNNEGLDAELAASLVSVSLLVGIVLINILPPLLAAVYL